MYKVLYRKYRPDKFDNVIGQDTIIRILKNSLKNQCVSHAYLFSGPRGTGKTTTARILAKAVNCNNPVDFDCCNNCDNCVSINNNSVDVIELDAASNNGVDEIRSIKEKINFSTTMLKYKVYIIDEVHMLSISAFNALLKVLEEPPKHVIFILATTNIQKVPITIVSRCQCLDFTRISPNNIELYLKSVIKEEKINVEDNALKLISNYCNGGMRDALGMLDKLISYSDGNVTANDFKNIFGIIDTEEYLKFFDDLKTQRFSNLFEFLNKINSDGKDLILFTEGLLMYVRDLIFGLCTKNVIDNSLLSEYTNFIFELNNLILEMKKSDQYKMLLEVGLISISKKIFSDCVCLTKSKKNTNNQKVVSVKSMKESKTTSKISENGEKVDNYMINRDIYINNAFTTASKENLKKLSNVWRNMDNKEKYEKQYNILKDSIIRVAGCEYLIVTFPYESLINHATKEYSNIIDYLDVLLGTKYKVAFLTNTEWETARNDYINKIKQNYEYKLITPIKENTKTNNSKKDDIVNLFGNDIIEYV